MLVHLRAIGAIEFPEGAASEADDYVDRKALLVYAGDFESMEGPVTVTSDQVRNLVRNHNSALAKIKRLVASTPLKEYPPVQLDHSASARDTVGRLLGDLVEGEYETPMGNRVPAVYGTLRILGKENVEKVKDGRWTHLSFGADFERGKVVELSITPFPAAAAASMLSSKKGKEVYCDYPDGKTHVKVDVDESTGKYHAYVDNKEIGDGYASKETAIEEAQKVAKDKIAPIPPQATHLASGDACKDCMEKAMRDYKEKGKSHDQAVAIAISECKHVCKTQPKKMEHGEMDKDKMKKYLTGHKKMSDKDADDHIEKMSKPEHADEMKKLSMDFDEWAKEEEKEHEKKLTAAREGITKLSAGFKDTLSKARLESSKGRIYSRLSKLRAQGKVTPAEIKKMDITNLAAMAPKEIDLVMKTYDDREPVILVGQVGSVKATELSNLGQEKRKLAQIEIETRKNWTSLASTVGAATKLASEHADQRTEDQAPPPVIADSDKDHMAYFEKEYEDIHRMFAEGRHGEAKEKLKAFMSKHMAMGAGHLAATDVNNEETERHLSALAENIETMQAQFEEVTKLAATLAG